MTREIKNIHLANQIGELCVDFYKSLPKSGKPTQNEWTVVSCIVKHDLNKNNFELVSLGTGSKCIGATKMSPKGDILNDSHAEVIARRGFLVYLYNNIEKTLGNTDSIFLYQDNMFHLKESIEFIFFSSQLPCGDASIIPKTKDIEQYGDVISPQKRPASEDISEIEGKKVKVNDVHRTGAKCLPEAEQDPKMPGTEYHICGQVRTKPGRGDKTLSVSCSDKMAKWVHMGIQGSLVSMLLAEPIFIKTFIFGAHVPFSEDSLARALLFRNKDKSVKLDHIPSFVQCQTNISALKSDIRCRPAAASILSINTLSKIHEVAILGKKLGVTKKEKDPIKISLCISKYHLYHMFCRIVSKNQTLMCRIVGDHELSQIPYNEMKKKSLNYYKKWQVVKENFFKVWTAKPDMWNFLISDS